MASEIKVVKFVNGVHVEVDNSSDVDILLKKIRTKQSADAITTGEDADLPSPASSFVMVTNVGLKSILNILPVTKNELLLLTNKTGDELVIKNAGNITTGTGDDLTLQNDASILLYHIESLNEYVVIGGSGSGGGKKIFGSTVAPIVLTNQTIPFTGRQDVTIMFCEADADGILNLSGINPQVAEGRVVGQELWFVPVSGTRLFQLGNGNGLTLLGDYLSDLNVVFKLLWNGSTWQDLR